MMSIGQTTAGQENYYVQDYYQNGETPGQWLGTGSTKLGLSGKVSRDALTNIWKGQSPDGLRDLVRLVDRASTSRRIPAWDLTVSAPKSVSVLWSQSDPKVRATIDESMWSAARAVVSYLESDVRLARRGAGGRERELADLVVAGFAHETSRRNDPQLHIHLLACNVCVRKDGTTGTLGEREIYRHKMAAGALFRTHLAHELIARLGVKMTSSQNDCFEIQGVPENLCEALSSRRKEIKEAMKELGFRSAKAAEIAALKTRRKKEPRYTRDQLFAGWSHVTAKYGFTAEQASKLVRSGSELNQSLIEPSVRAVRQIAELTRKNGHFAERDIVRSLAVTGQTLGWSAKTVLRGKEEALTYKNVQRLGNSDRLSTKTHIRLETKLMQAVDELRAKAGHPVKAETRQETYAKFKTLSPEQKKALSYLIKQPGAVKTVRGLPGTGKTMMLKSAQAAWKASGLQVVGVTLSGKAASELEHGAKIKSQTFEMLFRRMENARLYDRTVHVIDQFSRAAAGKPTFNNDALRLTSKTVVVVDEAAMATTRQLARLIKQVNRSGASIVMVGDDRQLQSIESGGVFAAIHRKIGGAELTTVIRQKQAWMRKAVVLASKGDARGALSTYAANGCLELTKSRKDALRTLVADWNKGRTKSLSDTIIIAGRNSDVSRLNQMAQQLRARRGELGVLKQRIKGTWIRRGDRLLITKNINKLKIRNGELATVKSIGLDSVTLKMDSPGRSLGKWVPRYVTIRKNQYDALKLGYAISSHKSQGATFKKSFVLLNTDYQNRELSLVQLSRASEQTRLYSPKSQAGEDLAELSAAMSKSLRKTLAIEQDQYQRIKQQRGLNM